MPEVTAQKKAEYRIGDLVGNIPASRLTEHKASLAAQLDISIGQLNRIIRGDSDPSGTQLWIIAQFFGCGVDELYAAYERPKISFGFFGVYTPPAQAGGIPQKPLKIPPGKRARFLRHLRRERRSIQ